MAACVAFVAGAARDLLVISSLAIAHALGFAA